MRRIPSVVTLREVFQHNAKQARKVLEMPFIELATTIDGAARIAECYHTPTTSDIRMHVLDTLAGTCGVEFMETRRGRYMYLNAGDLYVPTLIYSYATGSYRVACWGDIVERERSR